ncbi:MAG: VWA domain-containing protein [Saprospiraceae bacterium]
MKKSIFILFILGFLFQANAQEQKAPSPILFIYDASGSMWGQLDGKTKKEIASEVLSTAINKLPADQNIGLIAYGHRTKGDCQDVEFLVALDNHSKVKINDAIKGINPLGKTPLAYSAIQAINSLKTSKTKATIILVTDGIESCDGNICEVVTAAKAEGIDFKMHIVGFGLKEGETEQLKCAANAGGGNYYDAADASGLGDVLTEATAETIDDSPGTFTVFTIKNGKPIDGLVKAFKAGTQEEVDAIRTYGDTVFLSLPAGKYDLTAMALENSRVEPIFMSNIEAFDDKIAHQTISFDAGKINLITLNNEEGWDCTSKVINKAGKVVGGSRTYGRPKLIEVNPGVYDVEIQGLVMRGLETIHTFKEVVVESGKTIDISHSFKTGKASIGVTSNGVLVDATIDIKEKNTGKSVAGGRSYTSPSSNPKEFMVNPGIYEVVIKAVKKEMAGKSQTFTIEVKQGETVEKIVNF